MAAPSALRALAILLLAGGCGGGGPSWSASFAPGPVNSGTTLSVIAWKGKVRLLNSGSGLLEVKLRGAAPLPLDRLVTFAEDKRTARCSIRIDEAGKDADLDLEVAAPPGISLACSCADADVTIVGVWGELVVATGGAIDARVEARSGSLRSRRGDVVFAALGTGPTGEIRAESTSGDVAVTLPARWSGQLKFQTQAGKLDVPPHANLRTIWDEDKKGAVGRLGGPGDEGAPARAFGPTHMGGEPEALEPPPPPAVWATSGTGNVSFRVGE